LDLYRQERRMNAFVEEGERVFGIGRFSSPLTVGEHVMRVVFHTITVTCELNTPDSLILASDR
jgi:hypothetical protein